MKVKPTKIEITLLAATAAFLCLLAGLFVRDVRQPSGGVAVTAEFYAPPEEVAPPIVPLDLNAASAAELESLPGIGPALAERIVAYRTEHGDFAVAEDIQLVSGIGPGKFADLEGRITVGG